MVDMNKTALLFLVLCACFRASVASHKRLNNLRAEMANLTDICVEIIKLTENDRDTELLRFVANKYYLFVQDVFYNYHLAIRYARFGGEAREKIKKLVNKVETCTYAIGQRINGDAGELRRGVKSAFGCYLEIIDTMLAPIEELLKNNEQQQSIRSYLRMGYDYALYDFYMIYEQLSHRNRTTGEIYAELAESFDKSRRLLKKLRVDDADALEDLKFYVRFAAFLTEISMSNVDRWVYTRKDGATIASAILDVPYKLRSHMSDLRKHLRSNAPAGELYARLEVFYRGASAEFLEIDIEKVEYWKDIRRELFLDALYILNTFNSALEMLRTQ